MRTRGSLAATLLLLTVQFILINGQTVKHRRSRGPRNDGSRGRISEIVLVQEPGRINNAVLSLVEGQSGRGNSKVDQQVDQSETVIFPAEDLKDLENIEHALSTIEYEPQKINRKSKRKIVPTFNDPAVTSTENADSTVSNADIFYEVPRTAQPKRTYQNPTTVVTPKYYTKSIHESQKPLDTEAQSPSVSRKKTKIDGRDVEYVYALPEFSKASKPRFPKIRSQVNPQVPEGEPKLDVSPTSKPPLFRSLPSETRKPKQFVEEIATTTPSIETPYTRAARRKKGRKRVTERVTNQENSDQTTDTPRVRSSEARNKSRRLGVVSKYDTPRPFARSLPGKSNQRGSLEKSEDESAGGQGSTNRNTHPNALRNSEEVTRSPQTALNRRLYERKNAKQSSTTLNVNSSPFAEKPKKFEYQKPNGSSKIGTERPIPPYKSHQTVEVGSTEDSTAKTKPVQSTYATSLDHSLQVPSSTPSGLDTYESIKTPTVTVYTSSPSVSTVSPYVSPSSYSGSVVFYPPVVSTLAPIQQFEVSTVHSWSQPSKLQERDAGTITEEKKTEAVDGVAEATSLDSGEESRREQGKYDIHETPEGDQKETGNHAEDNYESQRGSNNHSEYNSVESAENEKDDSESRSSRQSYDNMKEDADAKGNQGGDGKFEQGGGTLREKGHQETDGDKGEKGYKSWHEHERANKGQHDKERRSNYYGEEDGKKKEHKEEGGYQEEHQEGEKAEKQAEFGEKGEHQKGYSTKGQHFVHKKDEFEKRTEFFDEFNEDGDFEKDGEFYEEHEMTKGGHEKVGHHDEQDREEKYGKESKYEKGGHYHDEKGQKIKEGEDSRYERNQAHGKKQDQHKGKKWAYEKGDGGDTDEGHKKSRR